tara:strand:+ start:130 stop:372 length:243 start_codon:yes stop_codon:yes gene_type:complete
MDTKSIKNIIQSSLSDSQVEVIDTTGSGDHFSVVVIADIFENMSLINRHKLIYKALNQFISKEIHALQLKTLTKKELSNE